MKCQKSGIFEHFRNLRFQKKAQSISINTIIVAAIALIVMVVVILIFTGRLRLFNTALNTCESNGGTCVAEEDLLGKPSCKGEFDRSLTQYDYVSSASSDANKGKCSSTFPKCCVQG